MSSDREKPSFHHDKPETPANKKHDEMRIVKNDGLSLLVSWGGAFAFACSLVLALTFKRNKKIVSPKRSRDSDSDLDVGGFEEITTRDVDDKAREMEELQLLLPSTSSDVISHSCHMTSKMLVKYTSIEDSKDENRPLTTDPISEKKEDENTVVIIYEEDQKYQNSEKSIESETQKYDIESSKVAKSFPSRAFDETWLAEWAYRLSTSSSSSSSLSSSSPEETSSSGVLMQEIDGDEKNIDIVIYINDDDENGKDEQTL